MSADAGGAKLQGDDALRRTLEWEEKAGSTEQKHAEVLQRIKKGLQDLQANDAALKERIDDLEDRVLQDLQKEQAAREADIRECRDLVGCENLSLNDCLGSVKELLARENEAWELQFKNLSDRLNKRATSCEVHVKELQERLAGEVAARERQCGAVQASFEERLRRQQEDAGQHMDRLERLQTGAWTDRAERLQASFDRALQEHHASVRECVGGLERLLHDFVDEHSQAQCAARDDFQQLDQQVELRFAEECAAREAIAQELRELGELVRSGSFLTEAPAPTSPSTPELHAQLSAEASARSSAAFAAVSELLVAERKAVDLRLSSAQEAAAREADAREARLREANQAALQDFLRKLETRLQQESRGSEIMELRKLVGADKISVNEVLGSVNELIAREQEARMHHTREVQQQFLAARSEHEGLQESVRKSLAERCGALEEQLASAKLSCAESGEKAAAELLSKDVECRLAGHQEKVQDQIRAQQERLEAQLRIVKEGIAVAWKDQLRVERQSWERQHEALRDLLSTETDVRERSLASLQALVQRGREDHLRLEKQLRDRQMEATRSQLALQGRLQSESEEQLQADRAACTAAARELLAMERGARERSYATLHDLVRCENEAMKDLLAQEQEARAASCSSLRDALQREREVREKQTDSNQEDLAQERALREEADQAIMDTVSEQRSAHEDQLEQEASRSFVQQRLESLERTASIFDGLVRAERAERSAEARRLWEALDSHTHDLKREKVHDGRAHEAKKEKAAWEPLDIHAHAAASEKVRQASAPCAPPIVAPLPGASLVLPRQRPVSASPRPLSATARPQRCITPPCAVTVPHALAGSSTVPVGSSQRAVSPQRILLPVPAMPTFGNAVSATATPSTEVASPWWASGSASTQASEPIAWTSPTLQRSPSSSCVLPNGCHSETLMCGTTRYVGEPHTSAEVMAPH